MKSKVRCEKCLRSESWVGVTKGEGPRELDEKVFAGGVKLKTCKFVEGVLWAISAIRLREIAASR